MITVLIAADLILQISLGLLYAANRKMVVSSVMTHFYNERNQYNAISMTFCTVIVLIWGSYCFMIHRIAPVLMSTALKGWLVFVCLVLPTLVVPYWIFKSVLKEYLEWAAKAIQEYEFDKNASETTELKSKIRDMDIENRQLRSEIAKLQDEWQRKIIVRQQRFYQLSDLIRNGLERGGIRLSEYQIRNDFRTNGADVIKSPSNDNAIFVRKELLSAYTHCIPPNIGLLQEWYYEEDEKRFLLAY